MGSMPLFLKICRNSFWIINSIVFINEPRMTRILTDSHRFCSFFLPLSSVFYSNLILYFLMLIARKNTVIPIRIKVSFQITPKVAPLSNMALMMMINHLAGIMLLMICNGNGILEMGKIKPERMMTGSINPIKESIMAVCCELETVEINIPNESAVMMNKTLSKASKNKLPSIGILNTKKPKSRIIVALIMDKKIYGNTLPIITWKGFMGETNNTSIVPNSFSLVMEMEVIIAETSIKMMVITPGTKLKTLFNSGL